MDNVLEQTTSPTLGDPYAELNLRHKEISDLLKFIEYVEAMTYDRETRERIQKFMRDNGYWPKK